MSISRYPIGSEWRKWDLHVHTWISRNFKGDRAAVIRQINGAKADVIGVNDYFSLDGYIDLANSGEIKTKVLLPVVELRMTNKLANRKATDAGTNLNFHLIFDPKIAERASLLVKSLKVHYPDGSERPIAALAPDELEQATVDFHGTLGELEAQKLREQTLVWLPYDEYGGIDEIDPDRDDFIKSNLTILSDLIGSGRRKQIDFFLWRDPKFTPEQYRTALGTLKPCIKGSDSHDATYPIGHLRDGNSNPVERFCWIKADPTFEGLRQIKYEPSDRIVIGVVPDKVTFISANSHLFVSSLTFKTTEDNNEWFDHVGTISFNADLVAIIGNKGGGKSALADLIAAAGNARNNRFSFLDSDKFFKLQAHEKYSAEIRFADGYVATKDAASPLFDASLPEKVVYLPQNFVADLCEREEILELTKEVERVIFSHVPEEDQLGLRTLEELTKALTSDLSPQMRDLRDLISSINLEIIALETKLTDRYRQLTENSLSELRRQLALLPLEEVEEAAAPEVPGEQRETTQIATLERRISERDAHLVSMQEQLNERTIKKQKIQTMLGEIATIETDVSQADLSEAAGLVRKHAPFEGPIISLTVARHAIDKATSALANEIIKIRRIQTTARSLQDRDRSALEEIRANLNAEQKHRDEERVRKEQVRRERERLIGNEEIEGSIKCYEHELDFLASGLHAELEKKRLARQKATAAILTNLLTQRSRLHNVFMHAQQYAEARSKEFDIPSGDIMGFSVKLKLDPSFSKRFLDMINQKVRGTFLTIADGREELESILEECDLENGEGIESLPGTLENALWVSRRLTTPDRPPQPVQEIEPQLLVSKKNFYDYLYSLDYLDFGYELRFGGKPLEVLSPGERGTLLLMFYLLVDRDRRPIIIDQPEENLDNETVFQRLVPFLKMVKRERQVFIVTHNPNIAVVCDAEQIIHCSIDKGNNSLVSYLPGSIEFEGIRKATIDILEGTPPAFLNRRDKYSPTLRGGS